MASFMKDDDVLLPSTLLKMERPLPVETHGLGLLGRDFDIWGSVVSKTPDNVPKRSSSGAAGHDIKSDMDIEIPSNGSAVISTGVKVALPPGHFGKIEGRSGLAINHDVVAFGGVIDEDYRGEIKVKLFNHGDVPYSVSSGDRVAQLVIQKYACPSFSIVKSLSPTRRGTSGFGSTGR